MKLKVQLKCKCSGAKSLGVKRSQVTEGSWNIAVGR